MYGVGCRLCVVVIVVTAFFTISRDHDSFYHAFIHASAYGWWSAGLDADVVCSEAELPSLLGLPRRRWEKDAGAQY